MEYYSHKPLLRLKKEQNHQSAINREQIIHATRPTSTVPRQRSRPPELKPIKVSCTSPLVYIKGVHIGKNGVEPRFFWPDGVIPPCPLLAVSGHSSGYFLADWMIAVGRQKKAPTSGAL